MSETAKIIRLLKGPSAQHRIAACVVLGAIKHRSPEAKKAIEAMLDADAPAEQRVALEALGAMGARAALPKIVTLLGSRDPSVREAAIDALVSAGEAAVKIIEKRRPDATPDEQRAMDTALARLGGDHAFLTLLDGMKDTEEENARAAALEVRRKVREADAKTKRAYLSQTLKFIKRKDVRQEPEALASALKILGYLEQEKATEPLLAHAVDERLPSEVRTEALIGLRFSLGKTKNTDAVAMALLDIAEEDDRALAMTALDTLANLELPKKATARLVSIAKGQDFRAARFAIEKLKAQGDKPALDALVKVLGEGPLRRAELAAEALEGNPDAIGPVLKVLVDTDEKERAVFARNVLRPLTEKFSRAHKNKLIKAACDKVAQGVPGYESVLQVAREADAKGTAKSLRELAQKLRKARKNDKAAVVLGLIQDQASPEDKFRLAMLELQKSTKNTSPAKRARDPALKLLRELLDEGADVESWLKKERALGQEERFYLGFHFIEEGYGVGEELLDQVIKKGGRTKLARMARNKKKLEAEA